MKREFGHFSPIGSHERELLVLTQSSKTFEILLEIFKQDNDKITLSQRTFGIIEKVTDGRKLDYLPFGT